METEVMRLRAIGALKERQAKESPIDQGVTPGQRLKRFRQNTAHLSERRLSGHETSPSHRADLPSGLSPKYVAERITRRTLSELPSPTSTIALPRHEQEQERENLISWAESENRIIAISDIAGSSSHPETETGGAEHEVYLHKDRDNKYVLRITKHNSYGHPWFDTSASQYLKRLTEFNYIYPYAPLEVIGIVIREDRHPAILTQQPFVYGIRKTNSSELATALKNNGYIHKGGHRWMEMATGITIEDVSVDNVLFQADNSAKFIDVIIDSETL